MTPIRFDGCFGWLHGTRDDQGCETAVLLCPALGHDARCAHRSFRLLADELAAAGYPALRFDYPGTGDSCDPDEGEYWSVWQHSIHAAIDFLRTATGARRVVLCGLRLGTLLATLVAARRDDVAGLILLVPVIIGRTYARELTAASRLREDGPGADGAPLEVDGLLLPPETLRLMSEVDLRKAPLGRVSKILISAPSASAALATCTQHWTARGADVVCSAFDGLQPLLRNTYLSEQAAADFSTLLAWLTAAIPQCPADMPPSMPHPWAVALRPPGCIETPLRFGPEDHLFGILCRPSRSTDSGTAESDLVVVIGNTGGDPHYGFGRFAVELARRLAAGGTASLRMDFAGLGDSVRHADRRCGETGAGEASTHVYETDRTPDLAAALDALEDLGYRRFAAQGLCSGAYHALHAALKDERFSVLVLVNLVFFKWRTGDSVEMLQRKTFRTPSYYAKSLSRKDVWYRLLRGDINLAGIVHAQGLRFMERAGALARYLAKRLGVRPKASFEQRTAQALARRNVRTLFLLDSEDASVRMLEAHFGPQATELRRFPGIAARIVHGLDHMLSRAAMRQTATEIIAEFLHADRDARPIRHRLPETARHVSAL